jgi:hypothetical protein
MIVVRGKDYFPLKAQRRKENRKGVECFLILECSSFAPPAPLREIL